MLFVEEEDEVEGRSPASLLEARLEVSLSLPSVGDRGRDGIYGCDTLLAQEPSAAQPQIHAG